MRRKNRAYLLIIPVALISLLSACDALSNQAVPVYTFSSGNLVVANESGQDLALFIDGIFVTGVPEGRMDFVVDVGVTGTQQEKLLRLFPAVEVINLEEPSGDRLYRSWNVVLVDRASLAERRTWRVGSDSVASSRYSGTMTLRYGNGSDYYVRVYTGGLSGSKIATLSSQAGSVVVGMDYGTWELTYEYLYDNGQGTGAETVAVVNTETVLGTEVPIYAVINSIQETPVRQVPLYEDIQTPPAVASGFLEVTNSTPTPATLWLDGTLIENVVTGDGIGSWVSTIPALSTYQYELTTGIHTLKALDAGGATICEADVAIPEDGMFSWNISSDS